MIIYCNIQNKNSFKLNVFFLLLKQVKSGKQTLYFCKQTCTSYFWQIFWSQWGIIIGLTRKCYWNALNVHHFFYLYLSFHSYSQTLSKTFSNCILNCIQTSSNFSFDWYSWNSCGTSPNLYLINLETFL